MSSTAAIQLLRIHCPFNQKGEAKALGAKWDKHDKTWYAPTAEIYLKLGKWHKPRTILNKDFKKPEPAIAKKKFKKYPKALMHQEPELYSMPQPYPPLKVVVESVPVTGLAEYKPWEKTGETEADYNARQRMGSYYKGVWGGVPSVSDYRRMKAGEYVMSTAYDTRGD